MSSALLSSVPAIRATVPVPGFLDRAARVAHEAVAAASAAWRLHKARRALEALDDRALADIGIGPGQADGAARHGRSGLARRPAAPPRTEARPIMPLSWTEWR